MVTEQHWCPDTYRMRTKACCGKAYRRLRQVLKSESGFGSAWRWARAPLLPERSLPQILCKSILGPCPCTKSCGFGTWIIAHLVNNLRAGGGTEGALQQRVILSNGSFSVDVRCVTSFHLPCVRTLEMFSICFPVPYMGQWRVEDLDRAESFGGIFEIRDIMLTNAQVAMSNRGMLLTPRLIFH